MIGPVVNPGPGQVVILAKVREKNSVKAVFFTGISINSYKDNGAWKLE